MVLDKRRISLLHYLYQQNRKVEMEQLKKQFGVSQRTIYYDIDQINGWLRQEQLEPIQKPYGQGFFLTKQTAEVLPDKLTLQDEWDYRFSPEERIRLTTLTLLTQHKPVPVQDLKNNVQVSRGTIFRDLQKISRDMDARGLTLAHENTGYVVQGQEKEKRQMMSDTMTTLLTDNNNDHIKQKLNHILHPSDPAEETNLFSIIQDEIAALEDVLDVSFTEDMFQLLILQIMIAVQRKSHDFSLAVDEEEKKILESTRAFEAARQLNDRLREKGFQPLPKQEIHLLTIQILGSRVHYDPRTGSNTKAMEQLRMVIKKIVDDFQVTACIIFEERKQLEDNLFVHLKPTYFRLKYGLSLNNHYYRDIQTHYPDIYDLTKRSLSHLESFIGSPIPKEETAYIAMHFGGWLRRENQTSVKKYRGVVVCENGIAASGMVRAQVESLLPEIMITDTLSIREYNNQPVETDIVFSTSFIKQKQTPIIYLPTILNETDRESVVYRARKCLKPDAAGFHNIEGLMNIIDHHTDIHDKEALQEKLESFLSSRHSVKKETYKPMLDELLTEQTIQFEQEVQDWEHAVRLASDPLLRLEHIQQDYVEAMIGNIRENGPYVVIAPHIALPHARPEEGVDKLGMSLLHLKHPVFFSDQEKHQARLVIVLAAVDNETHLQALSQLTEMLSDAGNTEQLLEAEKAEDILSLVTHYSLQGGQ
ncbi:BglG family transcription antiterminator [Salibacterium halotolerans]|uniref:Transcriptional antiterminator n=1 Tax=Salibacterium halotolerans TaxID=1884432 RepID=A0A1I5W820_9BACI|nr:BglG family transcription antiterminator [Salibacterium halotolerans]SFQ15888.1 Transcriptional antiterminator [Salibacterium halotolerans]